MLYIRYTYTVYGIYIRYRVYNWNLCCRSDRNKNVDFKTGREGVPLFNIMIKIRHKHAVQNSSFS